MKFHHALLLISPSPEDKKNILAEYTKSCEMVYQTFDEFRIADARQLIALATKTPTNKSQQCLVVEAKQIAVEAQNALLKILEEPPQSTLFVFILPTIPSLPTVCSRFMIQYGTSDVSTSHHDFLVKTVPERLSFITTITKNKDQEAIQLVVSEVIDFLQDRSQRCTAADLETCHYCLRNINRRGASVKMLLEELAFRLPVVAI
jgi:DNA polymerase III delta prime subunit